MALTATIEVPAGQTDPATFVVTLRITNRTGSNIAILNPDMGVPSPAMNWPDSDKTYQTSLLMSFHYLSMSVTDDAGQELPQQISEAWATPILWPKLELAPGDSFELASPIGSFYQLESGRAYWVALEYGDQDLKVSARTRLTAP